MGTAHREAKRRSAKDVMIPLIIGLLGIVGVALVAILGSGYQFIDVALLILIVAFAVVGYTQRILRGVMTIPFLYIATGAAATFYELAAPYIGAPFGDFREVEPPHGVKALTFLVLTLAIWIALEAITRSFFKDVSLPGLKILDNLGGMLVYLVIGILVATLIFNAFGYGQRWRGTTGSAKLRSAFREVMRIHYTTQAFWFSRGEPRFYTDDLD